MLAVSSVSTEHFQSRWDIQLSDWFAGNIRWLPFNEHQSAHSLTNTWIHCTWPGANITLSSKYAIMTDIESDAPKPLPDHGFPLDFNMHVCCAIFVSYPHFLMVNSGTRMISAAGGVQDRKYHLQWSPFPDRVH